MHQESMNVTEGAQLAQPILSVDGCSVNTIATNLATHNVDMAPPDLDSVPSDESDSVIDLQHSVGDTHQRGYSSVEPDYSDKHDVTDSVDDQSKVIMDSYSSDDDDNNNDSNKSHNCDQVLNTTAKQQTVSDMTSNDKTKFFSRVESFDFAYTGPDCPEDEANNTTLSSLCATDSPILEHVLSLSPANNLFKVLDEFNESRFSPDHQKMISDLTLDLLPSPPSIVRKSSPVSMNLDDTEMENAADVDKDNEELMEDEVGENKDDIEMEDEIEKDTDNTDAINVGEYADNAEIKDGGNITDDADATDATGGVVFTNTGDEKTNNAEDAKAEKRTESTEIMDIDEINNYHNINVIESTIETRREDNNQTSASCESPLLNTIAATQCSLPMNASTSSASLKEEKSVNNSCHEERESEVFSSTLCDDTKDIEVTYESNDIRSTTLEPSESKLQHNDERVEVPCNEDSNSNTEQPAIKHIPVYRSRAINFYAKTDNRLLSQPWNVKSKSHDSYKTKAKSTKDVVSCPTSPTFTKEEIECPLSPGGNTYAESRIRFIGTFDAIKLSFDDSDTETEEKSQEAPLSSQDALQLFLDDEGSVEAAVLWKPSDIIPKIQDNDNTRNTSQTVEAEDLVCVKAKIAEFESTIKSEVATFDTSTDRPNETSCYVQSNVDSGKSISSSSVPHTMDNDDKSAPSTPEAKSVSTSTVSSKAQTSPVSVFGAPVTFFGLPEGATIYDFLPTSKYDVACNAERRDSFGALLQEYDDIVKEETPSEVYSNDDYMVKSTSSTARRMQIGTIEKTHAMSFEVDVDDKGKITIHRPSYTGEASQELDKKDTSVEACCNEYQCCAWDVFSNP